MKDQVSTKNPKHTESAKDVRDTVDIQDCLLESPSYLLDTSAILASNQDEPGASTIEDLFEILYLTNSREGSKKAFSLLFQVRNL